MLDAESRGGGRKVLGIRLRNDDATLVRRTQAGDEQAFAAIFERHHAPLLAYCRHMLGNRDDGEDALQQAFIKAHRALLGGTTPRDLRPWLYAIARNCCLSAIAARRPTTALEDHTPALAGLSDEVRRREDLRELLDGIGRLPEDQRSALLLAELEDLSHQAIATVVGCPVSKVKALIYQARSALIADRDARETPCQEIREQLAVARGGELRRGPLRRHLSLCTGCRDFQLAVGVQRQSLATLLPVAPSAGLMAAILGHGGAHAAGAAGIGGVGAGAAPASGALGTSAGVTGVGATSSGAIAIAGGGTAVAGTATGASAGVGAGTTAGTLVGGGLVTKLAVGGAVAALAAAGAVVAHPRPTASSRSQVTRARLAAFAAHRGEAVANNGSIGPYGGATTVAGPTDGPSGDLAGEPPAALTDAGSPGTSAGADPFAAPTSGEGAQGLLPLTGTGPASIVSTTVSRQLKTEQRTSRHGSAAEARKARAKLRREALRRRALRLREARRRALLRKERRKALNRRHPLAPKPVKAAKAPTIPPPPPAAHVHRRHALPSSASDGTSEAGNGGESEEATKRQHRPQTTGTSTGSTKATGPNSQTSTTGTGEDKGKTSSGTGSEKAGSTSGAGKSGASAGTGKAGSTGGKAKAGSGAGGRSGSTPGGEETGTGANTGSGGSESATGNGSANGTGHQTEQGDTAPGKGEASGAGTTSGRGSNPHAKKHLVEEEQLPNL
jgi:RNA polymerase sigma factor (sigma-70 family)